MPWIVAGGGPKFNSAEFWRWSGMVTKEHRGFASMHRTKQREIASKGDKAANQKGVAHRWTKEEAREAGRKGRLSPRREQR
jgi:general stress protein YciG